MQYTSLSYKVLESENASLVVGEKNGRDESKKIIMNPHSRNSEQQIGCLEVFSFYGLIIYQFDSRVTFESLVSRNHNSTII